MFGYIRPLAGELKVREHELFKACYCGLCRALAREYGHISRFSLSYDMTFLAMLLWDSRDEPRAASARCVRSPLRKRAYCAAAAPFEVCAGYSVILARWKAEDSLRDGGFFEAAGGGLLLAALGRAYARAARKHGDFDAEVRKGVFALRELEEAGTDSLDKCADKFASITAAMAAGVADSKRRRALEELLYHAGRAVYILDACEDLEEDFGRGRFNPLIGRFGLKAGGLVEDQAQAVRASLIGSFSRVAAAFELLPENAWTPVLRNIIYLGMPEVCRRVLEGTWNKGKLRDNRGNGKND